MAGELFRRLAAAAGAAWPAYTRHEFVLAVARGDLPEAAFRRYLVQDYLFLLHFARAWGLAIYKSETLAEMRRAHSLVAATLDVEIGPERMADPAPRHDGNPYREWLDMYAGAEYQTLAREALAALDELFLRRG